MQEIIPFDYQGRAIRVLRDEQGEQWWVATDICGVLEIADVSSTLRGLDEDEKTTLHITRSHIEHGLSDNSPGTSLNLINEAGLYSLILRSRKPEAKTFKRWVTHEVLPQIRKTGSYTDPSSKAPKRGHFSVARVRADFRALVGLHRDFGLDKNQALLAAEKVMNREFSVKITQYLALPDMDENLKCLALSSPVQELFYNVTEIGVQLNPVQSAVKVNRLLSRLGLQVDAIIGGRKTWALTEFGKTYGRYLDVGKARQDGTPIQQIRWRTKTVEILQAALRDQSLDNREQG